MFARILCFAATLFALTAAAATSVDLSGSGWRFKTTTEAEFRAVSIPHTWMTDAGYEKYVGHALYQRAFDAPALKQGQIVRLHFDAVYDTARVWLNGKQLGTHDGGYTPFEFDVTKLLQPTGNRLLVEVDNTPTLTSIPALAAGHPSNDNPVGRPTIVGWMPYGGIIRPVSLLVSEAVYLGPVKAEAKPNLSTGDAALLLRVTLKNASGTAKKITPTASIAGLTANFRSVTVPAHGAVIVSWTGTLKHAHLWNVRDPYLYDLKVEVPGDSYATHIGVREIRVRGTELLLNGRPVHLFGANRVADDPKEGLREPDNVIERDMSDMLADNMRMMRIAHYPQPPALLDYADRHGMLIIPEAGNWNMSAWQMADPEIRARFKRQQREMIETEWNHPSVVAWSVGNEYESYTEGGRAWTRDMKAYTLSLDNTRLITFADRYTGDPAVKSGADDASQYCDFVSINVYGNYAKRFDHAHELYPDKPIFVTEFGKMGEPGLHDPQRIADITEAVHAMKERPWMIGGSLWTWNDYRSLIRGTPASGIRSWGVVNVNRERRDSWKVVQKLFETELP